MNKLKNYLAEKNKEREREIFKKEIEEKLKMIKILLNIR